MSKRYRVQNFFEWLLHPYKPRSGNLISPAGNHRDAMVKRYDYYSGKQGLRFLSFYNYNMGIWRKVDANNTKDLREKSSPPVGSGPPKFNFPVWARFLLGSVLTFFLPFWKDKWAKFKMIEGEAEMVVEQLENVAEIVEKVATVAEKVSAEVAENLPDDSKLKKAAMAVELVTEITAKDAHATTLFIHQVEAIKHDVDGLVEPIVNKIAKKEGKEK